MDKLITTRIETGSYEALKSLAEQEDRSVSWLVRRAVEGFLAEHDADDDVPPAAGA